MKTIVVKRFHFNDSFPDLEAVSKRLDNEGGRNRIDTINWAGFTYKPDVSFSIGYTAHELLLKYYVAEAYFRAEKTETNQEVYEDSCVEFFVTPGEDGVYYNFEFNGIGTCLMGWATGRNDRQRADPGIVSSIRRTGSAGATPVAEREGAFSWTITIAIPFSIFFCHTTGPAAGKIFRANFYKCGDKLKVPHYVTWNPVETEKPDFHQPPFFGQLVFES